MEGWSDENGPRVVFATAPWCANCRAMRPLVDAAVASRGTPMVEIEAEESPDAVDALDIRSVPTVIAFRDGAEVARLVGARDRGAIEALVDAAESGVAPSRPRGRPTGELIFLRAVVAVVLVTVGIVVGTPILAVIGAGVGLWLAGDLLPR